MRTNVLPPDLKFIGSWSQRDEEIESLSNRIALTIKKLANVSEEFGQWYLAYKTIEDRSRGEVPLNSNRSAICQSLEESYESESKGEASYSFSMFAGPPHADLQEVALLRLRIYVNRPFLDNSLSLKIGRNFEVSSSLNWVAAISEISKQLALVWDLNWLSYVDLGSDPVVRLWPRGPLLGIVTFLSHRIADVPAAPTGWSRSEINATGATYSFQESMNNSGNIISRRDFERMANSIARNQKGQDSLF